jgi:integrase
MGRRKTGEQPQLRFHAHSGQARVRINGKVIYLGPWDSPEANAGYHALLAEWHSSGGTISSTPPPVPTPPKQTAPPAPSPQPPAGLTLAEVCVLWMAHCEKKYSRPDGTQSSTIHESRMIVRALAPDGAIPAGSFKARALINLQEREVANGRPRVTVNRIVKGVRRLFRWAAVMEYAPDSAVHILEAVEPLKPGQTEAEELPPVTDVPEEHVEATLRQLHRIPADLLRFMRLVGCRPGEVCKIRPMDVDTTGPIWRWTLPKHKNTWRGHERVALIGPKAQVILTPYLRRAPQLYCFSPAESERERCWWRRRNRKSPMTPSQSARKPKAEPMCKPKSHYSTSSIWCAVQRACRRAKVPNWATNQLRHNAATEARELLGLDAAQARLGHRTANITQVYASVTEKRGAEVAKLLG